MAGAPAPNRGPPRTRPPHPATGSKDPGTRDGTDSGPGPVTIRTPGPATIPTRVIRWVPPVIRRTPTGTRTRVPTPRRSTPTIRGRGTGTGRRRATARTPTGRAPRTVTARPARGRRPTTTARPGPGRRTGRRTTAAGTPGTAGATPPTRTSSRSTRTPAPSRTTTPPRTPTRPPVPPGGGQPEPPPPGPRVPWNRAGAQDPYQDPDHEAGRPGGEPEPAGVATGHDRGADHDAAPGHDPAGGTAGARTARRSLLPADIEDTADTEDAEGDEDDGAGDGRSAGGGRDRRGKKRRNGLACLVVAVVLTGFAGGVAYFGYDLYQSHFGSPPDYSGQGSGEVAVEIPDGAGVADIGNILKGQGVVKSTDAFIEAANSHPKGGSIQPGAYTLRKEMSAEAAVRMMTDPASMNALIVTEGMRNVQVYAAIDKKIGLPAGTTAGVAEREADNLGLPAWAEPHAQVKDPLEGFLYPARYSVGKDAKPEAVLRDMVRHATKEYAEHDLAGKAEELGLDSPLELVTVASLVQAEGVTSDDFRKMSEVIYNRLKPDNVETVGKLQFDSTYNYAKNQSKIDITLEEIKNLDHPYNTYYYRGLPPGPIGNPGAEALEAAQEPTHDGWYYFISLDGRTTKFTKTYAEHDRLVDEFNERRRKND
ncbi:endolytic transglycosylase MltG [Streptomyces pactum]|uniref:Endolytic murein transglycosylase n=1 Tax=Streptomyces pactum TaxID=68249 RepID=A0ABS0NRW9_9ACTN|nr:endolytic transglycosylase MltG [Streptomyces pactum]